MTTGRALHPGQWDEMHGTQHRSVLQHRRPASLLQTVHGSRHYHAYHADRLPSTASCRRRFCGLLQQPLAFSPVLKMRFEAANLF